MIQSREDIKKGLEEIFQETEENVGKHLKTLENLKKILGKPNGKP